AYGKFAEVEYRGGQHRGGMALADAVDEVVEIADAAGGDDRYGDTVGDGLRQRQVEPLPCAVAVHRGQQDFAGAERYHFLRVFDGVDPGGVAPAMGEDLPALTAAGALDPLGVDRNHDALLAEFFGGLPDEFPVADGSRVDRDLVGPVPQQRLDIVDGAHPAADRQRHEAGLLRAPHDIQHGAAVFVGRGNVEEAQFVGAGRVIRNRRFHGIAGIAQVDKIDALDDPAVLDVETRDHADLEHGETPMLRRARCGSASGQRWDRADRHKARGPQWRRPACWRGA